MCSPYFPCKDPWFAPGLPPSRSGQARLPLGDTERLLEDAVRRKGHVESPRWRSSNTQELTDIMMDIYIYNV